MARRDNLISTLVVGKKNGDRLESYIVSRTFFFVNGMNLRAELLCEWQGFSTKGALLQQEVLYTEVVFSLCIPFYGCFIYENNISVLHVVLYTEQPCPFGLCIAG